MEEKKEPPPITVTPTPTPSSCLAREWEECRDKGIHVRVFEDGLPAGACWCGERHESPDPVTLDIHVTTVNKHRLNEEGSFVSRLTGKVKWFNDQKGYGFIEQPGGPDIFVHYSAIEGEGYRSLSEGDLVEFEVTQGPKGQQAENVIKL